MILDSLARHWLDVAVLTDCLLFLALLPAHFVSLHLRVIGLSQRPERELLISGVYTYISLHKHRAAQCRAT